MRSIRRGLLFASVAVIGVSCASGAVCADAVLAPEARLALEAESARLDFAPVLPCGIGRGFSVTSVASDELPGGATGRRLNFIVERRGERAYVLSETRAAVMSTQIPQGTRRVTVSGGAATAEGFAGSSGSGGEMIYLRWRLDGVTYELDATLGRAMDEADVRRIAEALIRRG